MPKDNLEDTLDLTGVSQAINGEGNSVNRSMMLDDSGLFGGANDFDDRMALHLMEVAYVKSKGLKVGSDESLNLFPMNWYNSGNFDTKIEALAEAIEKDIDLKEY